MQIVSSRRYASKRARVAPVLGHFGLTTDWRLEGWCWSPTEPAERQSVEITVNGAVVRTSLATHYNERVRQAGMGDGKCGFSLSPPRQIGAANDGEAVVEAREVRSGTVLGRVVFHPEQALSARTSLLQHLGQNIAIRLETVPIIANDRIQTIADSLAAFGQALVLHRLLKGDAIVTRNIPSDLIAASLKSAKMLLARHRPLALEVTQSPRISFIICAAQDVRDTLSALRHVVKSLPKIAKELILLDNGEHGVTSLLATSVVGLRTVRCRTTLYTAGAFNDAVKLARGETICLVEDAGDLIAVESEILALLRGQATFAAGAIVGLDRRLVDWNPQPKSSGLTITVQRNDFDAVGGLEPIGGSGKPAWEDFAYKLHSIGIKIVATSERTAVDRLAV